METTITSDGGDGGGLDAMIANAGTTTRQTNTERGDDDDDDDVVRGVDVQAMDAIMANEHEQRGERRDHQGRRGGNDRRRGDNNRRYNNDRGGRGDNRRYNNDRGRGYREPAPTRPGWMPTGDVDENGRPAHSGQCEGCRVSTVVNFRPVVGGNPPLCGVCLDSVKAATAGAEDASGSGGPNRRRSQHGGRGPRFSPYGGQMVMVDPRMMGYGGGRGGGMMMMAPAPYGAMMGRGGAGGRGKSRTWTREGGGAAGEDAGADTSNIPCLFFQRGACRAGDACKYSHAGDGANSSPAAVPTGDDAAMAT